MKRSYWHILAITIITAVAAWLRLANLGAINFYNDEYYHVNTAVGYLKSGEFKQYNFYTQQLEKPYTRAKIFTWQVAKSFQWFGVSETSARLPAAIWGIVLIPIVIIVLLIAGKHTIAAYTVGLWLTFDNFFIDQARFTRMYSMVSVLTIVSVFCAYQYFTVKNKNIRYTYLTVCAIALLLNILAFKELTLALLVGLGAYCTMRSIIFVFTRQKTDRVFARWWFGGAIGAALLVGLRLLGFNTVPLDAAKILSVPHWSYVYYVVSELRLPIVAGVALIAGLSMVKNYRSFTAWQGIIGLSVLAYFIFLGRHEEAKRYIGFILPFVYYIVVVGVAQILQGFTKLEAWTKKTGVIITCVVLGVIGPKISWPGVPADGFILQKAPADKTYAELQRSDVRTAYHYVANRYKKGEVVLIQGPRYYYWPDRSIPVEELGYYKSLSLEDFRQLVTSSDAGVWVVYSQQRQRHVSPEIRNYIKEHFTKVETLDNTLVNVYYLNQPLNPLKGTLPQ